MNDTSNVNVSRERMLAAADDAVADSGLAALTVDGSARAAGLSRATAYRLFSGRDDLLIGLALRRAHRYVDRTRELMSAEAGFGSQIEAGFAFLAQVLPDDEVIKAMFAMRTAPMADPRVRALASQFLRPYVEAGQETGELRGEIGLESIVAWLIDQLLLMVNTVDGDVACVRSRVRDFIVPSVAQYGSAATDPALLTKVRVARQRLEAAVEALDDVADYAHDT